LNGVLFKILFERSRSAYYQSLETHLSAIEQHLYKDTNVNQENPLHGEAILMETFHHASIAAYQAEDEINSTFNLYLLIGGIIGAGLPTIQGLVIQTLDQQRPSLALIFSATAAIILVIVGILSLCFLERFLQLAKERYDNVKTMNNIQDFYSRKLEAQMPDLADVLSKQRASGRGFSVPLVIRLTVIVIGSLYFGGAVAIAAQTLVSTILLSAMTFVIALVLNFSYYYVRKSKMGK
jgi:hypothetical protein